jgi:predicted DCC family thiol-disulfide oxidoreductase YuxK
VNTDNSDINNINGWVCFDAECAGCVKLVRRFGPLLGRHRFVLVPLQTPWVRERVAAGNEELLSEMRLITAPSWIRGGADALTEIARQIWWAKPVYWISRVPLLRGGLRAGYRWVARHRTCLGGSCSIGAHPKCSPVSAVGAISALLPTALAVCLGRTLPAWIWMWVIALALFLGAKWVTILRFLRSGERAGPVRLFACALLWPGMDVQAFCGTEPVLPPPNRECALGAAKTLFGAAVIWVGTPSMGAANPLVTGWVGMIGVVLLLHFGLFHLVSLLWRALGINARPIMQSPAAATSLSRFWGGSWNAAFTDLMHEILFKPLSRQLGARGALFLVFLVSGVLHELVISVPARGGYGLPTAYFVLQGLALLFEHSKPGRKLRIGSGWRGWCFAALVAGVPAFCLFHPVFIHRVILPMLHAIGAT